MVNKTAHIWLLHNLNQLVILTATSVLSMMELHFQEYLNIQKRYVEETPKKKKKDKRLALKKEEKIWGSSFVSILHNLEGDWGAVFSWSDKYVQVASEGHEECAVTQFCRGFKPSSVHATRRLLCQPSMRETLSGCGPPFGNKVQHRLQEAAEVVGLFFGPLVLLH